MQQALCCKIFLVPVFRNVVDKILGRLSELPKGGVMRHFKHVSRVVRGVRWHSVQVKQIGTGLEEIHGSPPANFLQDKFRETFSRFDRLSDLNTKQLLEISKKFAAAGDEASSKMLVELMRERGSTELDKFVVNRLRSVWRLGPEAAALVLKEVREAELLESDKAVSAAIDAVTKYRQERLKDEHDEIDPATFRKQSKQLLETEMSLIRRGDVLAVSNSSAETSVDDEDPLSRLPEEHIRNFEELPDDGRLVSWKVISPAILSYAKVGRVGLASDLFETTVGQGKARKDESWRLADVYPLLAIWFSKGLLPQNVDTLKQFIEMSEERSVLDKICARCVSICLQAHEGNFEAVAKTREDLSNLLSEESSPEGPKAEKTTVYLADAFGILLQTMIRSGVTEDFDSMAESFLSLGPLPSSEELLIGLHLWEKLEEDDISYAHANFRNRMLLTTIEKNLRTDRNVSWEEIVPARNIKHFGASFVVMELLRAGRTDDAYNFVSHSSSLKEYNVFVELLSADDITLERAAKVIDLMKTRKVPVTYDAFLHYCQAFGPESDLPKFLKVLDEARGLEDLTFDKMAELTKPLREFLTLTPEVLDQINQSLAEGSDTSTEAVVLDTLVENALLPTAKELASRTQSPEAEVMILRADPLHLEDLLEGDRRVSQDAVTEAVRSCIAKDRPDLALRIIERAKSLANHVPSEDACEELLSATPMGEREKLRNKLKAIT